MKKEIILKRKDGSTLVGVLKELNIKYIDKMVKLDKSVYENLENKDFYVCSTREEYEKALIGNGKVLGCLLPGKNELIAMGVYISYGYNEHNYGYDLNICNEDLLKVGQIEATVVANEYRGNKLQKIICEELEALAKKENMRILSATAAPENKYSVNTFLNLNYKIMVEKLKYGGLRRYVFMKEI